jgi:hypothetical protein
MLGTDFKLWMLYERPRFAHSEKEDFEFADKLAFRFDRAAAEWVASIRRARFTRRPAENRLSPGCEMG